MTTTKSFDLKHIQTMWRGLSAMTDDLPHDFAAMLKAADKAERANYRPIDTKHPNIWLARKNVLRHVAKGFFNPNGDFADLAYTREGCRHAILLGAMLAKWRDEGRPSYHFAIGDLCEKAREEGNIVNLG